MTDVSAQYERADVAAAYRTARALPAEASAVWVAAFKRALDGASVRRALDVGAGTGRFTRLLAHAVSAPVIAIEKSSGMTDARETRDLASVRFARGVAESLPLRSASVDVALLSMVYHQITDRDAALRELSRVMRAEARVLVRTPTRETLGEFPPQWMRCFPEVVAFDIARMPSHAGLVEQFEGARFALRAHTVVRQRIAANLAEYVARIGSRAYSSMQALPDDVWMRRFAEFEAYCRTAPDGPVDEPVNLFVFEGI
jgi:ubiquinone/menaquinone biosynthesis C-methylase UbiE